jgi:hypothetical protein
MRALIALAVLFALLLAAPALARPDDARRVSVRGVSGPWLMPDRLIGVDGNAREGFSITSEPLSGGAREDVAFVPPADGWPIDVPIAASPQLLAFARNAYVPSRQGSRGPLFSEVWAGPFRGPHERLERCEPTVEGGSMEVAVDGDALAYFVPSCAHQRARVVLIDPRAGGPVAVEVADLDASSLTLAGRFAAYRGGDVGGPLLVVIDLQERRQVLRLGYQNLFSDRSHWVSAAHMQRDGKVAALYDDRAAGVARLAWLTPDDHTPREVPGSLGPEIRSSGARLRLASDRAVYVVNRKRPCARLTMTDLAGRTWPIACVHPVFARFDWNGDHVTWVETSCSGGDVGYIASRAAVERADEPRPGTCPVRLRTTRVRMRDDVGRLRVHCPRGCSGYADLYTANHRRVGELVFGPYLRAGRARVYLRPYRRAQRFMRAGSPRVVTGTLMVHSSGDGKPRPRGKIRLTLTFRGSEK